MNRARPCLLRTGHEDGFVLAVVIVFLVVLSISAFLGAALSRTNIQVVHNLHNEKEAFYIAEAGITEALLRTRPTATGDTATVDGLVFPLDIVPDPDPAWTARVTFTLVEPQTTGKVFTTPTLQPASNRLPYSDVADGAESLLTIRWLVENGAIRQVSGRKILEMRSTGRSGAARRTVSVAGIELAGCSSGGMCTLSDTCAAVNLRGQADVHFEGGVTINSGCGPNALDLGINTSLSTDVGIDLVGGYNGKGSVSPSPHPVSAFDDPLAGLEYPSAGSCTANDTRITSNAITTLSPGVYCGGINFGGSGTVVLNPGLYVIAGGELSTSGAPGVRVATNQADPGVTFFVTKHPNTGSWGSVDFGPPGNTVVNLIAPTSTEHGGIPGMLIFQHRDNPNQINLRGTFTSGLDGVIYAASANLNVQDQGGGAKDLNVSAVVGTASFTGDATFRGPTVPPPGEFAATNGYGVIAWKDWTDF